MSHINLSSITNFRRSKSQWMSDTTHIINVSKFSTQWTLATTLPPISELKLTIFLLHFTVSKFPKSFSTGSYRFKSDSSLIQIKPVQKINLHWFHLVLVFYPTYAFWIFNLLRPLRIDTGDFLISMTGTESHSPRLMGK